MPRLCERPGCSAPADVAYGFDADTLVVWLDRFELDQGVRAGVLCRRHADAMVVPLGWMLDDRREPVPRLFSAARMQDLTDGMARPRSRRRHSDRNSDRNDRNGDRTIEMIRTAVMQLSLDDTGNGEGVVHELGPMPLVAERDQPVEVVAVEPVEPIDPVADEVVADEVVADEVVADPEESEEPEVEQGEAQVLPWQPRFDPSDDLSGLLRARGRLLSRAFQGLAADGS